MPLGLMLMRAPSSLMRCVAFLCILSGVMYVGIFEHYRLHHPRVTSGGPSPDRAWSLFSASSRQAHLLPGSSCRCERARRPSLEGGCALALDQHHLIYSALTVVEAVSQG
jgi:hypothetical protein